MVEKNEVSVSGKFEYQDKKSKDRCLIHPACFPGACGFYLGHDHDWTPDKLKPIATQSMFDEDSAISKIYIYDNGETESEITNFLKNGGRND